MRKTDVIIYGAGPAGITAALNLHQKGIEVIVVEKMKFPRFVIGESLLPKCMDYLEKVGAIAHLEQKGFQKKYGAIFEREDQQCQFSFAEQYSESYSWTWQVQRSNFDFSLAELALERGIEILFEHEVETLQNSPNVQVTAIKNLNTTERFDITSRFVIDASGYGRVIPKLFDLNRPSDVTSRGAVFAHFEDPNRIPVSGENIIIFPFNDNTAWAWMIPFSDQSCSVGVVGENEFVSSLAADDHAGFLELVNTHNGFNNRFTNTAFTTSPQSILGYSVSVSSLFGEGYVLCGNSTEFLDPIFSSGVTLAVASGYDASELTAQELAGEEVNWKTEYEDKIWKGIDVFRSYVNSWYDGDLQKIFFADKIDPIMKHQICSVLSGHVWDESNPFVTKHKRIISMLAQVIDIHNKTKA